MVCECSRLPLRRVPLDRVLATRTLRLEAALRSKGALPSEAQLVAVWRQVDAVKAAGEKPLVAAARKLFSDQQDDVVARLATWWSKKAAGPVVLRGEGDALAGVVFDLAKWAAQIDARFGPLIRAALREGYEAGALRVDLQAEGAPDTEMTRQTVAESVARTRGVNETTAARLARTLTEGITGGDSLAQLEARVRSVFTSARGYRARLIAQAAASPAFEAGQVAAFEEAGIETHAWLSQRDKRVRGAHDDADGQSVALGSPFTVGGQEMRFPGDGSLGASAGNRIGCRCTTRPEIA